MAQKGQRESEYVLIVFGVGGLKYHCKRNGERCATLMEIGWMVAVIVW